MKQRDHYEMPGFDNLAGGFLCCGSYAMLQSPHYNHQARSNTHFSVYIAKMKLNSFATNINFIGNCLISFTGNNQLKDFQFTRGENRYI